MVLLTAPFDPNRTRRAGRLPRAGLLATIASLVLSTAGVLMGLSGGVVHDLGRGMASGGVHCAFLFAGWMIARGRLTGFAPVVYSAAALCLASITAAFTAWGALLYLVPPVILLYEGHRHAALRGIGLTVAAGVRSIALGLATGTFLGAHLLISASLTFGYVVRVSSIGPYLAAVAYDVGANALTAEWLFRGAVFSHWWQRWEFWPAAGLATALAVARYLADPALPQAIEVRTGAVFYIALLGLTACALRARAGSLLPGYLATVTFFAAYRMLGQ
jgi:hypothetical protein